MKALGVLALPAHAAMDKSISNAFPRSRPLVIGTALVLVLVIGLADYLTGYEISFSIFYLLPIALAVWFVGRPFAVLVSVLSVASWLGGDVAAGAVYSSKFVPAWNAAIALAFYLVVMWLLSGLKSSQETLEARVRQRTAALTSEMSKRERLEGEILAISEREQQRLGRDLHDSLCQHLTGTAMAGQVLEEKLAAKSLPEAADAEKVVLLVEEGITLARNMARGLSPVQLDAEGLPSVLEELAANTREKCGIDCRFYCAGGGAIADPMAAIHLYRIAQEAVTNAVRHGRASRIAISFSSTDHGPVLTIKDDGSGLPDALPAGNKGMGLHIMSHRAAMIGASFDAHRAPGGGTLVTCSPADAPSAARDGIHEK